MSRELWLLVLRFMDWLCLKGAGYQFWSGIGSGSPILAAVAIGYKHRNCHVKRCWRLGHVDPEHGHPACRHHHSLSDKLG